MRLLELPRGRLGAALAAVAAGGLLLGCGKGGQGTVTVGAGASAPTATATTPASPAPKGRGPSAAQARAFAAAVNLTPLDVPGFEASSKQHERETPAEQRLEHELLHCAGAIAGAGKQGRELSSPNFTRRGSELDQSVSSAVSFAGSAASAAKDLGVMRSSRARDCFAHYLDELFRGSRFGGGVLRRVSIAQGTPPAPGTTGGFGWRVTAAVLVRGVRVPFYLDILGFVYGPAEVTLTSSGVLIPFPAGIEEHLYGLLLQRARAHRL